MRVVLQRVSYAKVTINGEREEKIGKGILVLLGIEDIDTVDDIEWLCGKIARIRIFPDQDCIMNLDVNQIDGDVLVVSQFTLFASTKKGNRPSYIRASKPDVAKPIYESFLNEIKKHIHGNVKSGEFGADMQVELNNDGPVTILFDTKNKE